MKISLPFLFTLFLFNIHFNSNAQNDTITKLIGEPIDTAGWTFLDNAQLNSNERNSAISLAPTDNGSGAVYYNTPVNFSACKKWNVEFDFIITGRLAEGMTFCFLKSRFQNLVSENGLGIPDSADGLRICFDILSQCNPFDGNGPKIEVRWKPIGANVECYDDQPTIFSKPVLYSFTYNHASITYEDGHIRIYINNKLYLQCFHELNFTGYLGFTASSISYPYNGDQLKNVYIYSQSSPNIEKIVGQKFGLCGGGNFPFKAASIERSANNYNWSVPSGTTIISGAGTDSITLNIPSNFKEGILSVTANSQTCGTGNTVKEKISVRPNHPDTILGPEHVVAGQQNIKFRVVDTANVTYNWIVPADATIISGQGTDSLIVNWGQTAGRVHLKIYQCNDSVELKKNVHLQDCNVTIHGEHCVGDTLTASYNSTSGALVKLAWRDLNNKSVLRRDSFKTISIVPVNPNDIELDGIAHVFVDAHNKLYLSSVFENNVKRLSQDSIFSICIAGCFIGSGSGANQLNSPQGLFVDSDGNVYIADRNNNRVQKWAPGASSGVTVAGGNGQGSAANQLDYPMGVFVDADDNVYVADYNNNRVQKWAPGATSGTTVAGGNGQGSAANQLDNSIAVALDADGNVYVLDQYNNRVQKWAPGAISGITVAGGNGGGIAANQLSNPYDMTIDKSSNLYIADGSDRVQKWAPGAIEGITVAGGNGSGRRLNQFKYMAGISVGKDSSIYIADPENERILKYSSSKGSIDLSYVPLESNRYKVVATFADGCFTESTPVEVLDCNSAKNIAEQKIKDELIATNKNSKALIYPNPANSTIILSFTSEKTSNYNIQITDVSGKRLQHLEGVFSQGQNSIRLNISKYAAGIYFIVMMNNEKQQTLKFFKQ